MSIWTIEPRDPLVARDGRPNNGRSASATLPFPYPGTIAGIVRTRLGADDRGVFDPAQDLEALRKAAVRGPLLSRADGSGLYVPRPRDALILGGSVGEEVLRRLVPIACPPDALFDDDFGGAQVGLLGLERRSPGKAAGVPTWWPWAAFVRWLAEPEAMDGSNANKALAGAFRGLPVEGRSHLKVGETWTAEDGMLFEVRGLRFRTDETGALAIAFDIDQETAGSRTLRPGIGPSGGKRRLAYWQPAPSIRLPELPTEVRAALSTEAASVRVRVVLLTPAIFQAGWRPGGDPGKKQLLAPRSGVKPTLVAACVPRPETISGWDFARRGPKATRRLVSSGSVYWIDLEGTPPDRVRWAEEVMMQNVSDAEQDRRDGFGLAAVGVGT